MFPNYDNFGLDKFSIIIFPLFFKGFRNAPLFYCRIISN